MSLGLGHCKIASFMPDVNVVKIEPHLNVGFGTNNRQKRPNSIGIHNKGRGNKFFNNTFVGLDTAILDEGRDTEAGGNRIVK